MPSHIDMETSNGARLQVLDPERWHMEELAFAMRPQDRREITRTTNGMPVRKIIQESVSRSVYSRVAVIDNRVAAMWGLLVPVLMGELGYPWAMTTPVVDKHHKLFVAGSRFYIREMSKIAPRMSVWVDGEYRSALRWLTYLGFDVDKRITVNGFAFREAYLEAV